MVRQPTPKRQSEYKELKSFVLALAELIDTWFLTQPPGRVGSPGPDGKVVWKTVDTPRSSFAASLRSGIASLESDGFSKALQGVRMAVNDCLEMTRDLPKDAIKKADEFLASKDYKTLTLMRERVWRRIPKILRRGCIRNDEEYYLVIERLNDMSESGFQGADREKADRMIMAYETNHSLPRKD